MPREALEAFGPDTVDALARWAIDALVYPPVTIATYATRLPANEIRRGRAILDEAGIDWRALKPSPRSRKANDRERATT